MDKFYGVWQLERFTMSTKSGAVKFYPLGKKPFGVLIYTESGYMSVHLSKQKRKMFSSSLAMVGVGKKTEVNDTIRNYVTYCGRFSVEDNTVKHKIESHIIPNEVGKDYVRYFKFEDDQLILETVPMKIGVFSLVGVLAWTKRNE
ncbi:lipocalin-like domain-containing protein [Candidatus Uabimicrobium amorphum]|uniref:Lipocalin-like domain-containing protein n=1 Tax=Uabimicrobium amorphum TaxID=2596890 RepID=A0A5S9F5I7_UABAM|nr:lipocalin-like domain-containing protein [Candidatus Uabimicrobium amorphum]BBM85302.1 hypothetical protein UABAM_03666 [Candidatus Uabimicrobium amorphum]